MEPDAVDFPNKAKIVIVGGGAQGMAIAYKLAKQNYGEDIVVIDQVRPIEHTHTHTHTHYFMIV